MKGTKPVGETESERSVRMVLLTFIAPIFFVAGLFLGVYDNWETYRYRNLDLARITSASVRQVRDPYSAGPPVRFDDLSKLRDGLSILRRCSSEVMINHEHFEDGYAIALYVDGDDEPSYFLTSYSRTDKNPSKTGTETGAQGSFSCRPFQDWVNATVAPMFPPSK
ncbi:MAG: hypothetical protein PSX80_03915 [bacterium]|nr:hypothetical protein [bacterium]